MHRDLAALSLALVLVLSGCSTGPAGPTTAGADTVTPTPSPDETPTGTTTVTAASPPEPDPVPTASTESDIAAGTPLSDTATPGAVRYTDLSPRARDAFDAARTGTVVFGPRTRYLDGVDFGWAVRDAFEAPGGDTRYVVRNGTRYAAVLAVGSGVAQYGIEAERVDDDAVESPVMEHQNLPANVSDEVRWAVENGSYTTVWGKWHSLPRPLELERQYVRYEGAVYELSYVAADARLVELRVWPA
jgi:hypothetical protein